MLLSSLVKQEIFKQSRNSNKFLQNILFFILSCSIFLFISQDIKSQNSEIYFINIITISLVFSLVFANQSFLDQDFNDGTLEQVILFCQNLEIYIFAKILANWFLFSLPLIISSYFLVLLMGYENILGKLIFLISIASFSINAICAFSSCLSLSSNKSNMLAIFSFPLILPVLLMVFSLNKGLEEIILISEILIAFAIFFTLISVFTISKIIKIIMQ